MKKELKDACRSPRDMDEYLEVRSSQEIIDDIKASSSWEPPRGCICPPTSEKTCEGIGCPRQNPFKHGLL